jgi:hypothetical protein
VKQILKFVVILLFPLLAIPQTGVHAQGKQAKVLCVAFYNLENLFDTIDDPKIDDAEFLPKSASQWDSKKYFTKLSHLADVISRIGDEYTKNGPVFIGVSEVENRQVVEDLVHTPPLKTMGYDVVHYDSPDKRGIDVALLYQPKLFRVISSKPHPFLMADTGFHTRDILQVDGMLDGELVHVLVNHWPSRSGGEQESAFKRNAAADLCLSIVQSIYKEEPNAKIIIMGDLNDDPVDVSLMKHLKIKTKPENVHPGDLFDPMWQLFRDGIGSLAYRDSWNLFDQIIVSSALMDKNAPGFRYLKAKIFNQKFLVQKDGPYEGYPFRTYAGGVYTGGYSDHFPAYLFLVKEIK